MFDGKPPSLKSGELAKRTKARSQANENLKKAQETDNVEDQNKYSKMTVRWVGVCVCVCLCVCVRGTRNGLCRRPKQHNHFEMTVRWVRVWVHDDTQAHVRKRTHIHACTHLPTHIPILTHTHTTPTYHIYLYL